MSTKKKIKNPSNMIFGKRKPNEHYNEHASSLIAIKTAWVDNAIIPVVRWINSFDSACTLYSCEGTDSKGEGYEPGVMFDCFEEEDLRAILRTLTDILKNDSVRFRVEINYFQNARGRYYLRLADRTALNDLSKSVEIMFKYRWEDDVE